MNIFKRIANHIAIKWKYLVGRYVNFLIFPRKIKTFDYEVMTSQETVDMLIKDRLSCSRFGDGEIYLLMGKSIGFQKASASLTERMQEILTNPVGGHLICMTGIFSPTYQKADRKAELYNRDYVVRYEKFIKKNIPHSYLYGNSGFTRFYLNAREKKEEHFKRYISRIKELWGGRCLSY